MKIEDYWEDVMIYCVAYTTIESPGKVIEETVITPMIADIISEKSLMYSKKISPLGWMHQYYIDIIFESI